MHLAVGRAFWNRFSDIRMVAVNLHLKFPVSVVGGLASVPTVEFPGLRRRGGRAARGSFDQAPHPVEWKLTSDSAMSTTW